MSRDPDADKVRALQRREHLVRHAVLSRKGGRVAARRAGFGGRRFIGCPGYPLQTRSQRGV